MGSYLAELPVIPKLVTQLVSLDMTGEAAYDEVVSIAEEDPTFAVRVLALANSATFAPAQVIENIPQAVARIGAWRLAELAASMAVMDVFEPRDDSARTLWAHSVEVAVAARTLASELPGTDKQTAYLLGLVHDLGRLVYLRAQASEPESFRGLTAEVLCCDQIAASGALVTIRERALLGFDHAELGALAAEVIGLPPHLVELIRYHHEELPADRDLMAIVQLADSLSAHTHRGHLQPGQPNPEALARCYPRSWVRAGREPIDPGRIAGLLPRIFAESRALVTGLCG